MTIAAIFTIYDRPHDVLERMLESLPKADQYVCVFDRTPRDTRYFVHWWMQTYLPAKDLNRPIKIDVVSIEGEPGYRNPAKAWNAAYKAVTTEFIYQFSSEVIHQPENIERCLKWLKIAPCAVWGACTDSGEYGPVTNGPDPLLLVSAEYPRPLGFVCAFPTWAIRAIHGQDERYMDGQAWEDDDFVKRLWDLGLPYIFADAISGVHQAHPRAMLASKVGIALSEKNRLYTIAKHGHEHPWNGTFKRWYKRPGLSIATPDTFSGLKRAWEQFAQ